MPKITFIGADSAVFARNLMTDILGLDGVDEGEFALVDIDPVRLELARRIGEALIVRSGKHWRISASTARRELLPGSNYIISTVEVAGLTNVRHDYEIPLSYHIDQCIGDTIGSGGIFKALRTGPTWLEILRDAEHLCPDALVLNYTNPMSILTLVACLGSSMRVVGLCHSVQNTSHEIADYLQIPYNDLQWRCAGINHNAWFTELRVAGRDMYPRLRELAGDPAVYERDPVRFEMLLDFGAFVTESSGHFSEYVPYFRKRSDLIQRYCRAGYLGESGYYAKNWPRWRQENDRRTEEMINGTREMPSNRSLEYGASIIEAIELHRPTVIHGNVRNRGLIDNLPDCCVEVPCVADRHGVHGTFFGRIPEQLAALNRSHMAVHTLVAAALLQRDRQAARYALQLDPLTAAVCSPAEISNLFDEMWEAERADLQAFA